MAASGAPLYMGAWRELLSSAPERGAPRSPATGRDAIVVVATEGIEERTLKLMSMVLEETVPGLEPERLAFLSGPTFAREVAQGLPTDVVVASKGMVAARKVQDLVHSITLR